MWPLPMMHWTLPYMPTPPPRHQTPAPCPLDSRHGTSHTQKSRHWILRPSPPASGIWWRSLEISSNMFTLGPPPRWWPPLNHIWLASGLYPSYWNALLLIKFLWFELKLSIYLFNYKAIKIITDSVSGTADRFDLFAKYWLPWNLLILTPSRSSLAHNASASPLLTMYGTPRQSRSSLH